MFVSVFNGFFLLLVGLCSLLVTLFLSSSEVRHHFRRGILSSFLFFLFSGWVLIFEVYIGWVFLSMGWVMLLGFICVSFFFGRHRTTDL